MVFVAPVSLSAKFVPIRRTNVPSISAVCSPGLEGSTSCTSVKLAMARSRSNVTPKLVGEKSSVFWPTLSVTLSVLLKVSTKVSLPAPPDGPPKPESLPKCKMMVSSPVPPVSVSSCRPPSIVTGIDHVLTSITSAPSRPKIITSSMKAGNAGCVAGMKVFAVLSRTTSDTYSLSLPLSSSLTTSLTS